MYHEATLISAQRELEIANLTDGYEKYLAGQIAKADREGFDKRDDVAKMIRAAVPILSAGIATWMAQAAEGKGRRPAAYAPLKECDPDQIALGALSKTFQTVADGKALSATARSIGFFVQVEVEARMVEATDPKEAKRFLAMAEGQTERANLKRHEKIVEALGVGLEWTQRTQVLVGGAILGIILTDLRDLFYRDTVIDNRGTIPVVKFTEQALDQLSDMAEAAAWMQPILKPMIVQPRAWTHYDTGAYLDLRLSKTVPLVRTFNREHQTLIREAIKDGSMAELLEGVNAIQDTRFAIDRRVFEIMRWVREGNLAPAKSFPRDEAITPTAKMPKEEWEALPADARTALSRKRRSLKNLHEASTINVKVLGVDLAEAERLLDVPAFYLPHSLDFRGRVYAVPHFNPQRSDHIKALFRFADTHPMGEDGGNWLAIHLANCGDFKVENGRKASKAALQDRIDWAWANEAKILEAARDPEGTYFWWSTADSPFCFIQACFEWGEWAATGYSTDFESSISAALDGSCSGLQHYSAMNRSAEEGYHVNLLPRETPGDIYQVTADKGRPILEALVTRGEEHAEAAGIILSQGFGRGEVKRNVMTYFYGSGRFGMRDQHMGDLMRPLADRLALGEIEAHPYAMMTVRKNKETGEETSALDGGFTCAQLLANVVYSAITTVAPKADEAARWFQSVAATLAHESLPVIWRTPVGLPVVQRYSEYTSKQVNMWLYSRGVHVPQGHDKVDAEGNILSRIQVLIREAPTKRINKAKARSAIAPNVIHSLDAAHLTRTVVFAKREGIESFQLIHDSFATHLGKTTRFFQIIREAFVDMYETYDPFEELERYARSVLSEEGQEKLPPRPARGDLDLKQVLLSEYAFA